jgi:hypothetical protein
MRKKLCPQCKIHRFNVKNDKGETVVVIVNENYEIIPVHPEESLDGFDVTTLYCLGCSWQGSPKKLV